ncbi:putative aldouronate transport system permease protein [Anaerocolumna jejuensis DSM 15929]|uniref:Putative aldouronate transport system permease protein n=1 Tax=Anaerocolumna jejuensis DSM 15929 TaxID=1121322 RepID=A0A1M6JE38_9FIRM|nr:carbohydrate ABC transporter permease [Anaerocolumna jejuensis]SHJ44842.1 putative aldouronate transport system permease protein [Anaerocolumna jejuensis DSM 15929]
MRKKSTGRILFEIINYTVLFLLGSICLLPVIHILAISFSSNTAAAAGTVTLWPVGFTTYSYEYVAGRKEFWHAVLISLERVGIGVPLSMLLTIMIAYPLSKETSHFRMRTVYVWFFFFTMLFSGGLIPGYMLIQNLNMMDSIWALILPAAVPVYNIVLMLNFFRGIPKELEEASVIDGATQWQTCFRIYIPCAKPSIATLSLFTFVSHWNSWFDGLLFSNFSSNYPLASYLQTVVVRRDMTLLGAGDLQALMNISDRTVKSAQIFMGMLPIFIVYPFVQKHFVKGIVVGSVKG